MKRLILGLFLFSCLSFAQGSGGGITTTSARRFIRYQTNPATCSPGDVSYQISDTTYYECKTANTWTAFGSQGSVPTQFGIKQCTVIIGDPGAASSALADDNDSPVACGNNTTKDWTITGVSCWANAGSPTVTPILTGGSGTSILTGALTCGTAAWAAGTVNGSPVIHSFSANATTCSSTPCTADVNITTAGGTAKYIVVQIVGTIPLS